jgi:DNA polymerase-3 subunit gamma/tau
LVAKAANCASPVGGEACNECDSCKAFLEGQPIDFVEQDAASHNSVDDIRQLRENVVLSPMGGRYKVYLLDEVHMLSRGAENALLKTLEEPPPHIIFVLATTDPHKVATTIVSRCQRFDLRRIPTSEVTGRLSHIAGEEGFTLEEGSLQEIARSATGSLRDAINGLQQVVTFYGPSPSLEQVREALGLSVDERSGPLARATLAGDLKEGLSLIAQVRDDGVDMRQFKDQVVQYLRGLLLAKAGAAEALDLPQEDAAEAKAVSSDLKASEIVRALRTYGRVDFRDDPQSSLPLELALVEFASEGEAPVETGNDQPAQAQAPAPPQTAPPAPVAQAPKKAPEFSIPTAESTDAATAVTSADVVSKETPERVEEAAPKAAVGEAEEEGPAAADVEADLVERVRERCKDTDKQLGALLNGSCEVNSEGEEDVTLGFYHTFHLERIESGPNRGRLDELFSAELGRQVKVKLVHSPRERAPRRAKGGHLVEAARALGGKPVEGKGEEGGEARDG